MNSWLRFSGWPLRAKTAALLVAASVLPLMIAAFVDIRATRAQVVNDTAGDLEARSDQVAREIDAVNRGYQRSVNMLANAPVVAAYYRARPEDLAATSSNIAALMSAFGRSDPQLRGVAVLDATGVVTAASEIALVGLDMSSRQYVKEGLKGRFVISDVFLAEPQAGDVPSIAYATPVRHADQRIVGLAIIWVRAASLWQMFQSNKLLLGPGSFAALLDRHGIRIASSARQDVLFYPAGPLDPVELGQLVTERRFGAKTEAYTSSVRAFPELFAHARAATLDKAMFRGRTEVTGNVNFGVARRPETVGWTVFYFVTEEAVEARLAGMVRDRMLIAGACILLALGAGASVATVILRPVGALSEAAAAIGAGNLRARVRPQGGDELGQLGHGFNAMAERIEAQAEALETARDELELRVEQRTAELARTADRLKVEITERERAVEARTQLAAIVESSDDAIIGKTLEGIITSWNSGAQRLFGYSAEEITGRPMAVLIPEERAPEEPLILGRIARGESVDHFETERLRKDGSRLMVSATISPIRDGHGRIVGASHITRDITASKRAEGRLQAQLARMNLLDQISCAIGERQDLQSIYQVVIRSLEDQMPLDFCCICRYEPASSALIVVSVGITSQSLAMELVLTEKAHIEVDQNGLSQCVRGHLVYEADLEASTFPFPQRLARSGLRSVVIAPLQAEGQVFGILVSARHDANAFSSADCEFLRQLSQHVALAAQQADLYSALQSAYEDLRQSQQAVMQQERLRALGQMASGIAHDINNALSPAALYTQSLLEREENLSPKARDYLQQIDRAISDVAATVARMREFYRQREPQLALTTVRLNVLVRQVVELTRARWSDMAQQRGTVIEVVMDLADDLPTILGIESEIREALTNLVLNAVDAMPEGGALTVRSRLQASPTPQACVEITDTGVGMDEETRKRCLEPFYTTKGERGTGLGLAMVYGILQRHSAALDIRSAPGQGTTMSLRFAATEASEVPVPAGPETGSTPQCLRILVVDDDPLLLKSLQDTLESEGHAVQIANGGQAGIDAVAAAQEMAAPFSVVITDLGMPYVDGRKVASAVKQSSPGTPVILLTGWGERLVADGNIPENVDEVLSKPPKLRELRASLALHGGKSVDPRHATEPLS